MAYDPKIYWEERGLHYETGKPYKGADRINVDHLDHFLPFNSLVEIGCAYGESIISICDKYPDIRLAAVDISTSMLEVAEKRLFGCRVKLSLVDGETLPFLTNEFDIAYTCGMFIHVPPINIALYVKEVMRVCRVGCFCESRFKKRYNGRSIYFCHDYSAILDNLGFSYEVLGGSLRYGSESVLMSVKKP
jgi:ubiquinone/menaquinone biosynthesis C-methylase UbiE